MSSASSPPGGNSSRKRRGVSLRRRKVTSIAGFAPGDFLSVAWDTGKNEWRMLIESANGLVIEHKLLTPPAEAA